MSIKKKILFILHTPPPIHGSSVIGNYIYNSIVIKENYDCHFINLSTSNSINEIGTKGLKKYIKFFKIIWKVILAKKKYHPELCYMAITVKGFGLYKDSLIVFLIKLLKIRMIYHLHNKGVEINQNKLVENFIYKLIFKNVNVILLSKYLFKDIQKYVNLENIYYCPNGIPDIEYKETDPKLDSDKNIVKLLFVSNLFTSKGVYTLLNAIKILSKKQINFFCDFVGKEGDITQADFNKFLKENQLEDYVRYHGGKYGIEKHNYFIHADIFVFPTIYETFGLVNLEAMQYSLPVISTFEGGIPDVVDDNITGFLCKKEDFITLAKKIELLINDKTLRVSLGNAGRKKYENMYTIYHFENNLNNILKEILY